VHPLEPEPIKNKFNPIASAQGFLQNAPGALGAFVVGAAGAGIGAGAGFIEKIVATAVLGVVFGPAVAGFVGGALVFGTSLVGGIIGVAVATAYSKHTTRAMFSSAAGALTGVGALTYLTVAGIGAADSVVHPQPVVSNDNKATVSDIAVPSELPFKGAFRYSIG